MPHLPSLKKGRIERPMSVFRQQKALDRLEERLQRTEQLCADLDRENKKLDLEFTDLYDKVRRQMSRMAKRYAVDQKENLNDMDVQPETEPADGVDPISRSILRRRGMRANQP